MMNLKDTRGKRRKEEIKNTVQGIMRDEGMIPLGYTGRKFEMRRRSVEDGKGNGTG